MACAGCLRCSARPAESAIERIATVHSSLRACLPWPMAEERPLALQQDWPWLVGCNDLCAAVPLRVRRISKRGTTDRSVHRIKDRGNLDRAGMVPAQSLGHGHRPWGDRDQFLHVLRCQPKTGPFGCILCERPYGRLDPARVGKPGLRARPETSESTLPQTR